MIYINLDDKIYTAHEHALERIKEQGIIQKWIEQAMRDPDNMELSPTGRMRYDRNIDALNRALRVIVRVIVDEDDLLIVTVHWIDSRR